jgi:hypothetical protein
MRNLSLTAIGTISLLALIGSGGCTRPTTLGANTGIAYNVAKENQTLDPLAAEKLEPVVGLDGGAAVIEMQTYRKTFEDPDAAFQKSVVTTGVQTK